MLQARDHYGHAPGALLAAHNPGSERLGVFRRWGEWLAVPNPLSGSKSTSEEARRFLEQLFLSCGGVLQTIRIVDVDQALPELDGSFVL